jgi:hypothetical protein
VDRKEFFSTTAKGGLGCCALVLLDAITPAAAQQPAEPSLAEREREFVKNWLTDLFDSIDRELDAETKVRVMAGCGRGCFNRFEFKQALAKEGKGSVDKLIAACKKNFEVWREGDLVHIRYGEINKQCYCPAAKYHPARANDIHCECTRATHQAIWETALDRPVRVEVVESVRRGGKTCHFIAHVA